jgi:hypothetical protein
VQDLWAQTAWRTVEDNIRSGDALEKTSRRCPEKSYGFVIEILCIAFHSIAHRGSNSIWDEIINGPRDTTALLLYARRRQTGLTVNHSGKQVNTCTRSGPDIDLEGEYDALPNYFHDSAYEGSTEPEDKVLSKRCHGNSDTFIEAGAEFLVDLCDPAIEHTSTCKTSEKSKAGNPRRRETLEVAAIMTFVICTWWTIQAMPSQDTTPDLRCARIDQRLFSILRDKGGRRIPFKS